MSFWAKSRPAEPVLSFSPPVADFVRETYGAARRILEYGSGGSTMLAAELGRPVLAVESDPDWARWMNECLARRHSAAAAEVLWQDVGRTGGWGKPRDMSAAKDWHLYPLAVWDRPDFVQPDMILIDGRLRAACFVTALLRLTAPALVLFDDYRDRPRYREVERLLQPVRLVDRMAVFEVTPQAIPPAHLTWAIGRFADMAIADRKRRPEGG